jgi:hypothetical protein
MVNAQSSAASRTTAHKKAGTGTGTGTGTAKPMRMGTGTVKLQVSPLIDDRSPIDDCSALTFRGQAEAHKGCHDGGWEPVRLCPGLYSMLVCARSAEITRERERISI